jgi:hypothetical protein
VRVESGIAAALPRSEPLTSLVRGDRAWSHRARLAWDSVANTWNQWVLGYNPERQLGLMTRMGIGRGDWEALVTLLVVTTVAVTLGLFLLPLLSRKTYTDPVKRAYFVFCAKLAAAGLPRALSEGPAAYAERLARTRPQLETAVSTITGLYIRLRYGAHTDPLARRELERLVRDFRGVAP